MSTRNTLLGAALLVGAFFVGRALSPEPPTPPPPPPPQIVHQHVQPAQLRSAIRAELPQIQVARAQVPAAEPEPEPTEVREQRAAALVKAHGVVDAAIRAGRWTSQDARSLLAVMPQLGPDEYDEVMSALIRPVNAQQVKVETNGHLLDPS